MNKRNYSIFFDICNSFCLIYEFFRLLAIQKCPFKALAKLDILENAVYRGGGGEAI